MPFVPDSPRYLLSVGKRERARQIITDKHTTADDVEHEYAEVEFAETERQLEQDRSLDSSWVAIVRRPSYRYQTYIACSVYLPNQALLLESTVS